MTDVMRTSPVLNIYITTLLYQLFPHTLLVLLLVVVVLVVHLLEAER